jgi:dimethylamine/trimethylamine dehydrogenase
MECAIVLAKRGLRRVHLVDAAPEIGGLMRWVSRLPGLGEWARVVNWRRVQLDRLRNVEVLTGLELDAAEVRDYGAELVVCATGARWADDGLNAATHAPIPGADASLPHVLTPEQIVLEGKRPPGERVVVYDGEGYYAATGVAELLALEGCQVELVTLCDRIAAVCDETLEGPLVRQRLHEVGVGMRAGATLDRIQPDGVAGTDGHGEPFELPADGVVLCTMRRSNEQLFLELKGDPDALAEGGIEAVYRVGDCVAPRLIADVIFDGHRLAREIDSEDPATPLPYVRERATVERVRASTAASAIANAPGTSPTAP